MTLDTLPCELLDKIFFYANPLTLICASQSCVRFRSLIERYKERYKMRRAQLVLGSCRGQFHFYSSIDYCYCKGHVHMEYCRTYGYEEIFHSAITPALLSFIGTHNDRCSNPSDLGDVSTFQIVWFSDAPSLKRIHKIVDKFELTTPFLFESRMTEFPNINTVLKTPLKPHVLEDEKTLCDYFKKKLKCECHTELHHTRMVTKYLVRYKFYSTNK